MKCSCDYPVRRSSRIRHLSHCCYSQDIGRTKLEAIRKALRLPLPLQVQSIGVKRAWLPPRFQRKKLLGSAGTDPSWESQVGGETQIESHQVEGRDQVGGCDGAIVLHTMGVMLPFQGAQKAKNWVNENYSQALNFNAVCCVRLWTSLGLFSPYFLFLLEIGMSIPCLFHHFILETYNLFGFTDSQEINLSQSKPHSKSLLCLI
jgi:hypothetical protein